MKVRLVDFSKLTSDCWIVQLDGLRACDNCEFVDTDECGGKNIREYLLDNDEEEDLLE